jgi:hypothetical protein
VHDELRRGAEFRRAALSHRVPAPGGQQTHEIVTKPGSTMLLISQMDTSVLLKGRYVGRSEGVTSVHPHRIGNSTSGLHGLWTSTTYPNRVWCTLQNDNALLLLFPGWGDEGAPPKVVKRIDLPAKARGPHNIIEYGDYLWVGLKQTDAVLRINSRNPADYRKANLLHLAFDPWPEGDARPLWLLGTTITGVPGPDAIFKVTFDKDYVTAKLTDHVFLSTQQCASP